jgi:hypothetical protein
MTLQRGVSGLLQGRDDIGFTGLESGNEAKQEDRGEGQQEAEKQYSTPNAQVERERKPEGIRKPR